jgi:hypothetical protein
MRYLYAGLLMNAIDALEFEVSGDMHTLPSIDDLVSESPITESMESSRN